MEPVPPPPAASLRDVGKRYPSGHVALAGVTLDVPAGAVIGLVGRNGAGKTTLLSMIAGFLLPTSGVISVLGRSPAEARPLLGFSPEQPDYHLSFTARELLTRLVRIRGESGPGRSSRVSEALARVGLDAEASDRRLATYSKGMLQRFSLAQSLLGDPALLLLDEPMSGLDPLGQDEVARIITSLRSASRTLVVSSHQLSHVERLCDSVVLVDRGTVAYQGPPRAEGERARTTITLRTPLTAAQRSEAEARGALVTNERTLGIPGAAGREGRDSMLRWLLDEGADIDRMGSDSLEDIFLATVGGRR